MAELVHEREDDRATHQVLATHFAAELVRKVLKQLVTERDLSDIGIVGGVRFRAVRGVQGDVLWYAKRIVETNRDGVEEVVRDEPASEILELRGGGPVGCAEASRWG
jgi:hypothetical protein